MRGILLPRQSNASAARSVRVSNCPVLVIRYRGGAVKLITLHPGETQIGDVGYVEGGAYYTGYPVDCPIVNAMSAEWEISKIYPPVCIPKTLRQWRKSAEIYSPS